MTPYLWKLSCLHIDTIDRELIGELSQSLGVLGDLLCGGSCTLTFNSFYFTK